MTRPPCPNCGLGHHLDITAAVGRFRPNSPLGYVRHNDGRPAGPIRATRCEAAQDDPAETAQVLFRLGAAS